jgi:hypothetical protein
VKKIAAILKNKFLGDQNYLPQEYARRQRETNPEPSHMIRRFFHCL